MLKKRLIPVLLLQNGLLVRSELFETHQIIGAPIHEVRRFNEWSVDEIIYLDITREGAYDQRRNDHMVRNLDSPARVLEEVSKTCFVPLTWGGRLRTLDDMRERLNGGADKVAINTEAGRTPDLIDRAARSFGSQPIFVSIDVRRDETGPPEVFIEGGRTATGLDPTTWAQEVEARGAGELLLQSIERDGTGVGYDLDLIAAVAAAVAIPVIACSGVGRWSHYAEGIRAGASAVAAANIWHFKELADRAGKRALARAGIEVRI
jgi:cyclase